MEGIKPRTLKSSPRPNRKGRNGSGIKGKDVAHTVSIIDLATGD